MTKGQRIYLMADLWPRACECQRWKESDRDLRLQVCSAAVSFEITSYVEFLQAMELTLDQYPTLLKSTNELDGDRDFTRVKGLLLMLADDLKGALECGNEQPNRERQHRHAIADMSKCIALYHPNAKAAIQKIINQKFGQGKTVWDLTDAPISLRNGRTIPSQLWQLRVTLNRWLNSKKSGLRVLAGDSIHQMNVKAGVKCYCDECTTNRKDKAA